MLGKKYKTEMEKLIGEKESDIPGDIDFHGWYPLIENLETMMITDFISASDGESIAHGFHYKLRDYVIVDDNYMVHKKIAQNSSNLEYKDDWNYKTK